MNRRPALAHRHRPGRGGRGPAGEYLPPAVALAYLSAACDFHVSQVVDLVKGVHCRIPKADLAGLGEDEL